MQVLSEPLLQSLKAPHGKLLEITDRTCRGLQFRITKNDVRSWAYRFGFGSKVKRLYIGRYPAISLDEARRRADALRRKIRKAKVTPWEA